MTSPIDQTSGLIVSPELEVEPANSTGLSPRKGIGLEPTDSLAEAGRKVLSFHLERMLSCEADTRLGEDIEALHDMRVATRRMRTAFRVFGGSFTRKAVKPLITGLRATGRALGAVRDLDVILEKLHQYRATLPEPDQEGLAPLVEIWQNQQAEARQQLLIYLDSEKYRRFKKKFLSFVSAEGSGVKVFPAGVPRPYQLRHVVPKLIYTHYEAVRAYDGVLDSASWELLHQLRIAFKQFRYTMEYFQEVLGPEAAGMIKEVKLVQDHLGELNDAHVACNLLQDLLARWDKSQADIALSQRQNPAQVGLYLNVKLNERHYLMVSFPKVWLRFDKPEVRRALALAVSVL